jgi:hypothetical protein
MLVYIVGMVPQERVEQILSNETVEPHIDQRDIKQISSKRMNAIYQLIIKEIRNRDLRQISDLLGEDKTIESVESILEAFYGPLLAVCQVFLLFELLIC